MRVGDSPGIVIETLVTETWAISHECVIRLLERQLQVRSQIKERIAWGPRSVPGVDTGLQSPFCPFLGVWGGSLKRQVWPGCGLPSHCLW